MLIGERLRTQGLATTSSSRNTPLDRNNSVTPANPVPTLSGGAWARFNGFRRALGGITSGVGPLKSVMDDLSRLIEKYEGAASARSDYTALRTELEELFGVLSAHFSGNVPPTMTAAMDNLCIAVEGELDQISAQQNRPAAWRIWEAERDLDDVMNCYRRIKGHLERLTLNTGLSTWRIVDEQATESRLRSLKPSLAARYNSAEAHQVGRRDCTPNTRELVLAGLGDWRCNESLGNMYWMSGMAGTGKTTIASSFCTMLDQSYQLGASFFCSRLLPSCRDVNLILPTIAYQLARFSCPFRHALSTALQVDPDLHTKSLPYQLQGLIVDPLGKVSSALPAALVVVIDALDECEDNLAVGLLIEILASSASDLPLKVFISSRPEPQIRRKIGDINFKLILHELEVSVVKEDIRLYLQTELEGLSTPICESDLSTLVDRAGVLFIYAATVVRYIRTANSSFRRKIRLQAVLDINSAGSSRNGNDIDALYDAILAPAFSGSDLDDDEVKNRRLVLDKIVCLQEPLTVEALSRLLGLKDAGLVEDALEPLWSVVHVSGGDKHVSTLHASFPDYMLDPNRSKQYGCQGDKCHGRLVELCLDRIDRNERQFNVCMLESSYLFDSQVPNLDERVERAIPQDLWYACRYWPIHLKQARRNSPTKCWQRITNFVENRLLLWMEVLNLKKHMGVGASMFEMVVSQCQEGSAPRKTKALVHDAWRFIAMFAANDVSQSTVHLYTSMIATWPRSDPKLLAGNYMQRAEGVPKVGGTGMTWRQLELLGVFNGGNSKPILSLAFSPDGTRIVSGSFDNTIQVWDAQAGTLLLDPLQGHTNPVNSVTFSPDGMRIISGSDDSTIRVWDTYTGKPLLAPLEGHTLSVTSVAFSPDGTRLVSGSFDRTIRMWDAQTGKPLLHPLKGHGFLVKSVAFSPDGARIVSGSYDKTIRVWDVQTGKLLLNPLRGHAWSVNSVAFSPNSMRIVSGSYDGTVRVWDAKTGKQLLAILDGHTESVKSVAFSPDGTHIVSGSDDRTIRMWDARGGKPTLDPLKGHARPVNSVAFSRDGLRIVSGSNDSTIRVWDARPGKILRDRPRGHTDSVKSVAFSPDSTRIVSGSEDGTIGVWDTQTGELLLDLLKGHLRSVNSAVFSPDGMRIVSGSKDSTIRVWDAQTGKLFLHPLKGHTSSVNSVTFSPDGIRIVSGSSDCTIRVWGSQTGTPLLDPLRGHTSSVKSVAFSPDGKRIASGSNDGTIRVWSIHTGQPICNPFKPYTDRSTPRSINSVAFSPNGTRIVSGSDDWNIDLWDACTGDSLLRFHWDRRHKDSIRSVAFSPDGTRVISGSDDRTIQVWDAQTGMALLEPVQGHTGLIRSVGISSGGTLIVSGSDDGTIRVWDLVKLVLTPQPGSLVRPHPSLRSWELDKHGWALDQDGRPLLWVPHDLRDRLVLPTMVCLISPRGSVTLDFESANLGESWDECYTPRPCCLRGSVEEAEEPYVELGPGLLSLGCVMCVLVLAYLASYMGLSW